MDRALVVLALLPLLAAPARAQQSPLLATCATLMQWIDGDATFPRPGTTFCPVHQAFEKFAKDSGFSTWADLFSAAQAAPGAWRPYLGRIMQFSRSAAYVPATLVPRGESSVETLLVSSMDRAGTPSAMHALRLQNKGGGDKNKVVVTFGKGKNDPQRGKKAKVEQLDLQKTDAGVVHGVDAVIMPPDTFLNLREAMRRLKDVKQMRKIMRKMYEREMKDTSTWATVVAPMDAAWKSLKTKEPFPTWVGNITGRAVNKDKRLQQALGQYAFVKLPAGDVKQTLDHNRMYDIWRMAAAQNLVSVPTGLTVAKEQQLAYYTYDAESDQIYMVGHRNLRAQTVGADARSYMAGGALQKRTVYAGCATIVFTDSFVPLPRKTGLSEYDGGAAP